MQIAELASVVLPAMTAPTADLAAGGFDQVLAGALTAQTDGQIEAAGQGEAREESKTNEPIAQSNTTDLSQAVLAQTALGAPILLPPAPTAGATPVEQPAEADQLARVQSLVAAPELGVQKIEVRQTEQPADTEVAEVQSEVKPSSTSGGKQEVRPGAKPLSRALPEPLKPELPGETLPTGPAKTPEHVLEKARPEAAEQEPVLEGPERKTETSQRPAAADAVTAQASAAAQRASEHGGTNTDSRRQPDARAHAERMESLAARSGRQVEIFMHPADSGPLSVIVSREGSEVSASFKTQDDSLRGALSAGQSQLRESLRSGGLQLADLRFGTSTDSFHRHSSQSRQQPRESASTPFGPAQAPRTEQMMPARVAVSALDLWI